MDSRKKNKPKIFFFSVFFLFLLNAAWAQGKKKVKKTSGPVKWETRLNLSVYNKETFTELMKELDPKYPVLALSVANQGLMLIEDMDLAKEAFNQIVRTVDKGYPYSLMDIFNIGNLKLNDYDYFSQSYNFYKGVLAKSKNMKEWSEGFLRLIDKTNFNRFKYYEVLNLIKEKKYDEAKNQLRELLKLDHQSNHYSFVKKLTRALARLHFTLKEYDASKEIYQDFLLKLNPITPSDWVELAWIQYYQQDFSSALGSLVNLESKQGTATNFEPFIIKASIYKDLCDEKSVNKLYEEFNQKYKSLIDKVTYGALIEKDESLGELISLVSEEFSQIQFIKNRIMKEYASLSNDTSISNKKLIESIYNAELKRIEHLWDFYYEKFKPLAVSKIIEVSESLHFLSFSAAREKFNPKYVFAPEKKEKKSFFNYNALKKDFVLWRHNRYFFNDERLNYQVELFDQCDR